MPRRPAPTYSINMMKWWKKGYYEPGRVTRTLSPFQQRPADYLIKTLPQKTIRKVQENGLLMTVSAMALYGTYAYGLYEHDRYHRSHWD